MQTRNMEKSENNHQFKIIFNYNIFDKYFSKIFLILFYSFHKEKQALKSECRPPFQNSYNMCNQFYLQYL